MTPSALSSDKIILLKKMHKIRSSIPTAANRVYNIFDVTFTLDNLIEMSFSCLTDLVSHMQPTTCPTDLIPSCLLKDVFNVSVNVM